MFIYSITCAAGYMLSFWLHFLQSGASDLDIGSRSSSVHSLPAVENAPPTRTAHADLKVAVKHITEVKEEIRKNGIEIGKLLDVQSRMEKQLQDILQSLYTSSAQSRRGSELDSIDSGYEACRHSLNISKGDHKFQGEVTDTMAPVAATMRRHSMPATLDCVPEEGMDHIKKVR